MVIGFGMRGCVRVCGRRLLLLADISV